MHTEVTRLVTKWFKDSVHGVNALAAAIPRSTGSGGQDTKPPKVTIYNDVDTKGILTTSGLRPPSMPCIVVVSDVNQTTGDMKKKFASGHFMRGSTAVGFYAEQTQIEDDIILGDLVLRAVKQSLVLFNQADQSDRELNQVLISITDVEMQRVASAVPESHMLGVLFANLMVLDKLPTP